MSYVAINVLTVPEGRGEVLEQRFAGRAGSVDSAPGFEHFELLRPLEGTDTYLVYTRWRSQEDFAAWTASRSFEAGHAGRPGAGGPGAGHGHPGEAPAPAAAPAPAPAASDAQLWTFEVAQHSSAATPATPSS